MPSTPDPHIINMDRLKEQLILHEGYRTRMYKDSTGKPTIGVGFNLTRKDAEYLLKSIGANYDEIVAGNQELSDEQIEFLFNYTIEEAINGAKALINNFSDLFDVRLRAIIDMVFNLGVRKFALFKRTREAIENSEFTLAAQYMKESLWCAQVKSRCRRLSEMMASGVDYIL